MLRVSKFTDYAVVVLSRLEAEGGVQTAPGLASGTGVAEPTVAKVECWPRRGWWRGCAGRGADTACCARCHPAAVDVIVAIDARSP